jgi:hypothetical protein
MTPHKIFTHMMSSFSAPPAGLPAGVPLRQRNFLAAPPAGRRLGLFQRLERRTHAFSKDWKKQGPVFPGLGISRLGFSKPWKIAGAFFQGLETCHGQRLV